MLTIYVALCKNNRIKATTDKDCLPPDAIKVAEFVQTSPKTPAHLHDRFMFCLDSMRWLEKLGFTITIDFGAHFYDTPEG